MPAPEFSATSAALMLSEEHSPLRYRIALLGNPIAYPEWTDERLRALKDSGFNAIQLNIAWLRRPNDEALNLRDVVTLPGDEESSRTAERRAELLRRNDMAKKAGLRTIFHFGSPFMWRNPETGEIKPQAPEAFTSDPPWFDVNNPKVVEHEVGLLKGFRKAFPDVDDILVYTYDQDAWQTSEFQTSRLSRGVPLHQRLPGYLKALHAAWREGRGAKDNLMWWEPWELSAGQVYACLPHVPRQGFGMMLHNNIAEVQISMPADVWFRNTARMCHELGIPVVGEGFFGSATEEIEPLSFPFPRLTDEQLLAMIKVPGVAGVKEYFGVIPLAGDLNLEMFATRVANPDPKISTPDLLHRITKQFGDRQQAVLGLLEQLAAAMQTFPWDVSWYARLAGTANPDHGWDAAFIRGQQVETPSWESTRRAHFMMTEDKQPHPFLLEDVQLRCELSVKHMDQALLTGRSLIPALPPGVHRTMLEKALTDLEKFRRVARSYAFHLRETNIATLLRGDLEAGRPLNPKLVQEMKALLRDDSENQENKGRVVELEKVFQADPATFVRQHLKVTDKNPRERGVFTLTTR